MFTLLKFIFKMVIAVQIFNWLLAEADLIQPGVKDFALYTLEQYQIPTHDKMVEKSMPALIAIGNQLDRVIAEAHAEEFVENARADFRYKVERTRQGINNVKLGEFKYVVVNNLPVNPVETFSNKKLNQGLRGETMELEKF